ncbi:GNAT family N-acetyltransferase [Sphingomonas sp.]|uniref:GNAT family N-acetyltransferase n=1 Tax=Sphingomonas sp. TaxID=28214 RepID=UPI002ED80FBD
MLQARKAERAYAPTIVVRLHNGVPALLDDLAARTDPHHHFLRAAWYRMAAGEGAVTLAAIRPDGTPIAALPTTPLGPALIGARSVPGSYWPYRSIPLNPEASGAELSAFFANPASIAALGPAWRIGPIYADDPATVRIKRAAAAGGWTVLTRKLGRTFLFDTRDDSWPRRSTRRRLANYERQLAQLGEVTIREVSGAGWTRAVFDRLAAIEAASWVGTGTDGTGAKFLTDAKRAGWIEMMADPVLAQALSATILSVGGKPAAFSFDLRSGTMQYGIASSYDPRFAAFRPGKIVTAHQLEQARRAGVETIDLGAGDSGYKREMGAVAGPEILDLLIVRNRPAASLLRLRWGAESEIAREAYLAASKLRDAGHERGDRGRIEALLALGALAATVLTFAE